MQWHRLWARGLRAALAASFSLSAAAADVPSAAPTASRNQIWECTTNGLRTFSSNPCGTNPSLRPLNPLNLMEPTPSYRASPPYVPATESSPQAADASYQDSSNAVYPGYLVVQRAHRLHSNCHGTIGERSTAKPAVQLLPVRAATPLAPLQRRFVAAILPLKPARTYLSDSHPRALLP